MWTASDDAVWLENGSSTTFCSSRMVEIEPVIPHCNAVTVRKCSNVSTGRYIVQLQSSQSYTPQSAGVMRMPIELNALDISDMAYGKVAGRVIERAELMQGI